ncbi:hypothetical protein NPIL_312941, partial [Nephila pilipes]
FLGEAATDITYNAIVKAIYTWITMATINSNFFTLVLRGAKWLAAGTSTGLCQAASLGRAWQKWNSEAFCCTAKRIRAYEPAQPNTGASWRFTLRLYAVKVDDFTDEFM